ncbi:MAG TPA: carboxypeptidase regulatory-like domain-containing protein [Blastocatellia bacterium]|nr:carboxypeptidase regulatory-like domain-containing protein [Blastocatellia bacterium]
MSSKRRIITLGFCLLFSASFCFFHWSGIQSQAGSLLEGGALSGTVTDAKGLGLAGLFVGARHKATGRTTYVLTQAQGRFRFPSLGAGDYQVEVKDRGWRAEAQHIRLGDGNPSEANFKMSANAVGAPHLTSAELYPLLPDGEGRQILMSSCTGCHTLQILVSDRWNADGWRKIVDNLRNVFGAPVPQGKEELLISYLSTALAPESGLWRAAERVPPPQTKPIEVVYTSWDIPIEKGLPHTATLDARGDVWFTEAYLSRIGRLEVATGRFKIWDVPTPNSIPHGIVVDKKGKVWFTERLQFEPANKIARFDPDTEKFTEYALPRNVSGPHTPIFDSKGMLWITEYEGNRIARFDPETEKFTEYDVPTKDARPYGIDIDKDGVIWIAEIGNGGLGKLDPKTGKVTDYPTPTKNAGVRRVRADSKGRIWFTEFHGDHLGMFDPKTEKMTEYLLPGFRPQPYALEVTRDDKIMISTWHQDVMMLFDPDTKTFTTYPVPFLDLEVRDFRIDKDGAIWFVAMMPRKVVQMKLR